jgi:replication fork protection complex subunit Tof1/Swi1
LPDLRRVLAVIEQFEKAPLDLGGKRASQLLRKKKRRNRRRARQRPRAADSEGRSSDGEEEDEEQPSKARTVRAREREAYKSAQFIEDSDQEYGRDIDEFFVREAELRERTALAAVDSALGTGTMRASGTKKRRRVPATVVDDGGGGGGTRQTKRRAVLASSKRDSGAQSESESRASDDAPARRPPKPRPRYRGSATIGEPQQDPAAFLAPEVEDDSMSHDVGDQGRNVSEDENDGEDDESKNHRVAGGGAVANGSGPRKGRVIISGDEDE